MATKPADADVATDVRAVIGAFARREPATLSDADELIATLRLRDVDLPFLAMSLRGYVKRFKKSSTITTGEVRKAKTVAGTVTLVQGRIR